MAEVKGQADYRDPEHIPEKQEYDPGNIEPLAEQLAAFIRSKMYGVDVRETLARWVEINLAALEFLRDDQQAFKIDLTGKQTAVAQRQSDVEKRQTGLEKQFIDVITKATQDSEVINARDSSIYGPFGVLDLRLENIEQALALLAPAGYTVTINHGLGRNPTVTVVYYEYALGTELNGLGTGPDGTFGGTPSKTIESTVSYPDADKVKIDLPIGFKLIGDPVYQPADNRWYIIDGYRTLRFDLGVTDTDNPDTSGGSTSGGINDVPATPNEVSFTQLTETTGQLDWQTGA
ncbi:hypothetical protein [Lapidilactobacillus luobeiensis]|uniref:hypothetical protein n=1 Tax=Lapidilactobacillus luobeiensis TaxID=2950371 RepID=UPI0021C30FBD|nr:hypothetical protein [Lapidilactobacillus luobeiensis]